VKIAIIIGSESDRKYFVGIEDYLNFFGLEGEIKVMSAHRNPDDVADFGRNAEKEGVEVIIAAAGMAAALPGVIAAHTSLPVIGVPIPGSALSGMDSLFSIVQMPSGIPVATVSLGKAGAKNSVILAARILSLKYDEVKQKLDLFKSNEYKLR